MRIPIARVFAWRRREAYLVDFGTSYEEAFRAASGPSSWIVSLPVDDSDTSGRGLLEEHRLMCRPCGKNSPTRSRARSPAIAKSGDLVRRESDQREVCHFATFLYSMAWLFPPNTEGRSVRFLR
jgi:hypothetical protein